MLFADGGHSDGPGGKRPTWDTLLPPSALLANGPNDWVDAMEARHETTRRRGGDFQLARRLPEIENDAAGSPIATRWVTVDEAPADVVMVRVTKWSPLRRNLCAGAGPVAVAPSPKLHEYAAIVANGACDALGLNLIL